MDKDIQEKLAIWNYLNRHYDELYEVGFSSTFAFYIYENSKTLAEARSQLVADIKDEIQYSKNNGIPKDAIKKLMKLLKVIEEEC